MREIKFEYGFTNHAPIRVSLASIEQGLDLDGIGEVKYRRQYIGIDDINGKEIFEGDKVKHSEGVNYIEYDEDSAMFVLDCYSGKPLHHNMPFEIVGNDTNSC